MAHPLNVLLVHSHPLYGPCVSRRLAELDCFGSILWTADPRAALEWGDRAAGDVALVDGRIPDAGALELTRALRALAPELPILVFDVPGDREILRFAEAGASGCVPGDATVQQLVHRIHCVARGEAWYPRRVTRRLVSRLSELSNGKPQAPPPPARCRILTPRELEVLELVGWGLANKQIAGHLGVSVHTVKNHVHNVLDKLDAGSRWAAVAHAFEEGWLDFSPRTRRYPPDRSRSEDAATARQWTGQCPPGGAPDGPPHGRGPSAWPPRPGGGFPPDPGGTGTAGFRNGHPGAG